MFFQDFNIFKALHQTTSKDSQFSVPIRAPVRVLVGREAPGKFCLLWDSVILFILGFLKIKEEKKHFFQIKSKKKKKKKVLDFIPRGFPCGDFFHYMAPPQLGRQSGFLNAKTVCPWGGGVCCSNFNVTRVTKLELVTKGKSQSPITNHQRHLELAENLSHPPKNGFFF